MFEVRELQRKLSNLITAGIVIDVDYDLAKAKVKIGNNTTYWLPWLTQRARNTKTWFSPQINEKVIVISQSGEFNNGTIIGSLYSEDYPAPSNNQYEHKTTYEDGTVISYNSQIKQLVIEAVGNISIKANNINIQGNITVTGNISASGDILATGKNSNHHKH